MKQLFLLISMSLLFCTHANAERVQVILKPGSNTTVDKDGHKRTPVLIPTAYIDGHTLTFDSSCIGCTVTVLEDDIVVFCGTIDEEGTLILPDCLEGTFTIELQRGSITFVGEIEVE